MTLQPWLERAVVLGNTESELLVSGFRIHGPAFEFSAMRDATHFLEFGQFGEHIRMTNEERFQGFGGGWKLRKHVGGRRPCAVIGEDLIDKFEHHLFTQRRLQGLVIDHGATEPRHQAMVFGELLEFAPHIIWNHHVEALGFGVVKKNMVEPVGHHDVNVGFEDEVHPLIGLVDQRIDEHVGVNEHQRHKG